MLQLIQGEICMIDLGVDCPFNFSTSYNQAYILAIFLVICFFNWDTNEGLLNVW